MATRSKAVSADFMRSFCEALDEVEQAASGYGQMMACTIKAEDTGVMVTATYVDRGWVIETGVPS